MKYFLYVFAFVLAMATGFTAKAGSPSIGFANKLMVTNSRLAAMQASNSILVKKYNYSTAFADADKCAKYKKIQTAGIVLLSVGAVTFGTGIGLVVLGVGNAYYNDNDLATVGLIGGGVVLNVFGFGMMAAGTALTITGSVKLRKYCSAATGSIRKFYISPTTAHGLGFAARF